MHPILIGLLPTRYCKIFFGAFCVKRLVPIMAPWNCLYTHCTQASFDDTTPECNMVLSLRGLNMLQVIHFCPTASNNRVCIVGAFEWTAGCVPWNVRGGEHQPTNTRNRQTTLSEITQWYYDLDQPILWTRWIFQYFTYHPMCLTRKHKRIKFWQSCGDNDEPWQTDSNTKIAFIFN